MMSRNEQAAVAILLGDGDDQSQVAAGQVALGLLVLVEDGGTKTALFEQRADLAAPAHHREADHVRTGDGQLRLLKLFAPCAVEFKQPADGGEVDRNALGDLVLRVVFGRGDAHRAIEGKLALVHLLQRVHRLLRGVVGFEHAPPEDHAGRFDLLGETDLLFPGEQRNRAHLREVHADRIVDPLGSAFADRFFKNRLRVGVIKDIRAVIFGALAALAVLVFLFEFLEGIFDALDDLAFLQIGIDVDPAAALAAPRIVTLELQVRLKWSVEGDEFVSAHRFLIDELDAEALKEHQQFVQHLRIDHFVRDAGIDFLVADPTALLADCDKVAQGRMQLADGENHRVGLRGGSRGSGSGTQRVARWSAQGVSRSSTSMAGDGRR
jgi:hypothetical protein